MLCPIHGTSPFLYRSQKRGCSWVFVEWFYLAIDVPGNVGCEGRKANESCKFKFFEVCKSEDDELSEERRSVVYSSIEYSIPQLFSVNLTIPYTTHQVQA